MHRNPNWKFLRQAAMMVPADQMANPLQHTALTDAELLMREAIQNSADEHRPGSSGPVRFTVRRKQYKGDEKFTLAKKFDLDTVVKRASAFPKAHGWFKYDETCLARINDPDVALSVLILSDHNTNGLGGNWYTSEGINSRFYNLVLSIYASHKQESAGELLGSYGVGKMVYAVTSRIRTMAYYSCFEPTDSTDGATARFMATAFLPGHKLNGSDYTGHAFFGIPTDSSDYPAEPLIDNDAHKFAKSIGLELRKPSDTGLTVMLLDCDLAPVDCLKACEKYWWPRRFDEHAEEYIDLEFIDDGRRLDSPMPRYRADLKPFIDCYSNIKHGADSEGYERSTINLQACGEVGHLCMKALKETEAKNNVLANTVALIRSGLVIEYSAKYAREDDPDAVGVFETVGEFPTKCFTLSEPEAHDQWNCSNSRLQRSLGNSAVNLVRRTHDRIKAGFRDFQLRQKNVAHQDTNEGLDFLDKMLGRIFRKRKKGPPPFPKPTRRAFTVHKKGWRELKTDKTTDYLDFTIALAEGVSLKPVNCKVRVVLKILEHTEARPGESIPCAVFDNKGKVVPGITGTFEVDLLPDVALTFHASAEVQPTWKTLWKVVLESKAPVTNGGKSA